ncbi:ribonuclease H-like domain-containing protein [Tanacetum coccineum]
MFLVMSTIHVKNVEKLQKIRLLMSFHQKESWGCMDYASALTDIKADQELKKDMVKPKKPIWQIVSKRNSASSSGTKKNSQVSKKVTSPTNPFDALNTIGEGDELGSNGGSSNSGKKVVQDVAGSTSGKLVLLDDEGQPLKPSKSILPNYSVSKKVDDLVNEDSDSEVKEVRCKKTVECVACLLGRWNRSRGTEKCLGTRLSEDARGCGFLLIKLTETVRCFGTTVVVGETGSTIQDDGVIVDEHRRSLENVEINRFAGKTGRKTSTQVVLNRVMSKRVMCGDKQQPGAPGAGEQASELYDVGSSNRDGFGCDRGRGRGSVKSRDGNEHFRDKSYVTCYMYILAVHPRSAKEAWEFLENVFHHNKRMQTVALRGELMTLHIGDMTVDSYFGRIESIAALLTNLGSAIQDDDLVMYAINGLSDKYAHVDLRIKHKVSPSQNSHTTPSASTVLLAEGSSCDNREARQRDNHDTCRNISTTPCHNFGRTGYCKYGHGCILKHDNNSMNVNHSRNNVASNSYSNITRQASLHNPTGPSTRVNDIHGMGQVQILQLVQAQQHLLARYNLSQNMRQAHNNSQTHLAYAVSRFVYLCMTLESLTAHKRILCYVRGTLDYGLQLYSSSTSSLVAYSCAQLHAFSTSGYCVFLGKNLLRELHSPLHFVIIVLCDNVSAVYLSANLMQYQHTKRIKIDIHFVRDQVRVLQVPSRYQYADIFTKGPSSSALFDEFTPV